MMLTSVLRSRVGSATLQAVFLVLVLGFVLRVGIYSPFLGVAFAGLLVTLTLAALVGLERAASVFLILATAAAPLNDLRPVPALTFITFADVLFGIGFLLLVPHLAGTPLKLPAAFVFGFAIILAMGTLASVASEQPATSFNHMVRFSVGAVALATLICWWQPRKGTVIALASAYMAGNCISVFAAMFEGPTMGGRVFGLSTHPNVMGLCDALALALAPFLLYAVRREWRWLVVVGTAICAYGIWINGSRGALLTSVAILFLYPAITRSVTAGVAVTAIGFLMPIVVTHLVDRVSETSALGRLFGGGNARGSNQEREEAAARAIDQFLNHPLLGGGFVTVLEAHNIYLQLAAAVGVFGVLGFLIVLWSLVRPLLAIPSPWGLLSVPALAYAMAGLIFPLLWDRYIWCVLGLALLGPILAARAAEEDEDRTVETPHLLRETV